ncbi:xanthine dehydrogenase family protein subunit M [Streptomyces sp. SID13666]|uniref:FAD binding domain-containing protein n=1 Tax=Streptomyces fildesensis TaxID=375757 RepID=A0ABW8C824_9ACTN|nr:MULTISPECIES: xanthine dehydrogenase family protein subunit M [Streptomyces]MCM2422294.1 xanthine dehydrogenase family protein subunit M [Streptomyces sp. RKAG293]MCM2425511.1 xanthine dehydrogenase family protein subunit M [Streptomyces sp. RKAG337]MCZ4097218.1 xanthine dehydrogenase family protein subunit M [Streptomyces sp. H39-C1]NEA57305.1 xanthine dehydrogenase family protein subunit M [Streptomyces sp. SID13666]NEA73359.1 xanthine dehydrogenase family protein subunit M [Streptomyces 
MDFLRPASWEEALAAKAEHPTAVPIAGGTDVMVEINFDHRRPDVMLDLNRIGELQEWEVTEETVRLGASVPYTRIMEHLRTELPGLALAAHTVGSPQIRNRGSVGGNLGAASPAGDSHPALLAAGAEVEAVSVRGTRLIPVEEFYTGVKRNSLAADELIRAVHIKKADGPQQFSKVGTRNAMVIAVCAFGLALHPETRTVKTGIGSAAPTPLRARVAEDFLTAALEEGGFWENGKIIPPAVARQFAELVSGAANPIDDVRGTASYRRHALGVMARRTLGWTWDEYRGNERTQSCA